MYNVITNYERSNYIMKDKLLQIRVTEEFLLKVDYLKRINGFRNTAETVRKIVEKEWRKEQLEADNAIKWIPFDAQLPSKNQTIIFTEICKAAEKKPYVGMGIYLGEDEWNWHRTESEKERLKRDGYMADRHQIAGRRWHVEESNVVAWLPMPNPFK